MAIFSRDRMVNSILTLSIVIGLVSQYFYWPHLPLRVATHFGTGGQPDGWMDKSSATIMQCVLQAIMPMFFAGIGWVLPLFPNSMINVPHREYWLAPERRAQTLGAMKSMLSQFALCLSLFATVIGHLTYRANRTNGPLDLRLFLIAMGLFFVLIAIVLGVNLWKWRLPRAD
jgi:uncharacterized membrane protein